MKTVQTKLRLPGTLRALALQEQLYRYAEDLQQLVERNGALEADYDELLKSSCQLIQGCDELQDLMHSSRDMHLVTDTSGLILQSNPAANAIHAGGALLHSRLQDWVLPSHLDNFMALQAEVLARQTDSGHKLDLHLRSSEPASPPLIVSAQILAMLQDGNVHRLHWIMRDMTLLREAEIAKQLSSMAFKHADEGMIIADCKGKILAVNAAYTRITGFSQAEVLDSTPELASLGMQDARFYHEFWQVLRETGYWQGQIYNRKKNSEIYLEWLTVSSATDEKGRVSSYIAIFSDLTRLHKAEKKMAYLAHHDSLTGLPNRLLLHERINQALLQAKRLNSGFTLIFIDLDDFKQINDTLGHAIGDRVLLEVAKRLTGAVREVDTVARLGGDEFIILAPALAGSAQIEALCDKAIAILGQPMQIDGHKLQIGASFGCAEYPCHGEDENTLLNHADVAMYQAKALGGNTYTVYHGVQKS